MWKIISQLVSFVIPNYLVLFIPIHMGNFIICIGDPHQSPYYLVQSETVPFIGQVAYDSVPSLDHSKGLYHSVQTPSI